MSKQPPQFQLPVHLSLDPNSTVRFRVDTLYGYTSYGVQDFDKAMEAFENGGLRLKICRDIFDDGRTVAGLPEEEK